MPRMSVDSHAPVDAGPPERIADTFTKLMRSIAERRPPANELHDRDRAAFGVNTALMAERE